MSTAVEWPRDVVRVEGPDAASFLQGQLSQDVEALAAGDAAPSLLLQPTGKMGFLLGVTRVDDTTFDLEVDSGYGAAVVERLERFRLRTKVAFDLRPAPDLDEVDLHQSAVERVELGVPAMGHEIVDDVIPAELGSWVVDSAVSFAKGCYTGQELVARIDSRGGNVPRHLRGLVVDGAIAPPDGAEVLVDGASVGTVTSAGTSDTLAAPVALAFVRRSVDPPAQAVLRAPGYEAAAEIRALPLRASGAAAGG